MKKGVSFILILCCIFLSCSKDQSTNDTYYLTCTIDGAPRTFNLLAGSRRESNATNTAVFVHGVESASSNTADYGFVITNVPSGDDIIAADYTDTSTDFEILTAYKPDQASLGFDAGTTMLDEANMAGVTISNHFKVTITSINNETIKGTFSGDFYEDGDPHAAKKTISNGSFYLKFQ
jgi:hypothetical protein